MKQNVVVIIKEQGVARLLVCGGVDVFVVEERGGRKTVGRIEGQVVDVGAVVAQIGTGFWAHDSAGQGELALDLK